MKDPIYERFIAWYESINQNKSGSVFSPHKPLAILWALAGVLKGKRSITYNDDREALEDLIWSQTNLKSRPNCLQPLWRLCNDSNNIAVWTSLPKFPELNKSGDVPTGFANSSNFQAGFSDEFYTWLSNNRDITQQLIMHIIDDNFAESLHPEILDSLGMGEITPSVVESERIITTISKVKRDPNFPKLVMSAYDFRCCVCKLKLSLYNKPVPLEAAHIKWKAQGGEGSVHNGLALCPTHHYTFDKGIWTVGLDYELILSERVIIDSKHDTFFKPYVGHSVIETLMDDRFVPNEANILWHQKSIFKSA